MRRPPNVSTSQWFSQNALMARPWVKDARCPARPDLPWTIDGRPELDDTNEMAFICLGCPVMLKCADYALSANNGRGVEGGFYAGVWLPWPYASESLDVKVIRRRARLRLKHLFVS